MRKVIVNSTPLIALCHVDQLEVLKSIYGEITIPQAVYKEISAKQDSICKKQVDAALGWIHVENIQNENLLHTANINLKANSEYEFIKFGGIYHSEWLENAKENF
mgnify:CR=1 FL=1